MQSSILNTKSGQHIVLIRPDRIGDCVIGSVAINDLKTVLPDAKVTWVVRKPMAPLFSGETFPAELVAYDEAAGPGVLAEQLKKICPDAVVLLNSHPLTDAAAMMSGAPSRIGFCSKLTGALTAVSALNKEDGLLHEAEYARNLLRLLPGLKNVCFEEMRPCVAPYAAEKEWRGLLGEAALEQGFIVVHPGAYGSKMRVPIGVWADVAGMLLAQIGYTLVLIGDVLPQASEDCWSLHVPAIDLRGKLSLGATACMLAQAKLCLSRDSGPAHIAAAVGCPTVCIFLENIPTMGPVRWTPLGKAVRTVVTQIKPYWYEEWWFNLYRRRAAKHIRAEDIVNSAKSLLAGVYG